jgi:hypothetical protein
MSDNTDLIGKTFRNGHDGVMRYKVTSVDNEFPSLVHHENLTTGATGCAIGEFVRLAIIDEEAELNERNNAA